MHLEASNPCEPSITLRGYEETQESPYEGHYCRGAAGSLEGRKTVSGSKRGRSVAGGAAGKMQFFGADIEKANQVEDTRIGTRGPKNLLELLPDEFTLEDAKRVRTQQGLSNEDHKCQKMIRTWMNRKYVIQNTEYSFQKCK